MIKKLKRKFILLTMTALLGLLVVIVGGMNIINYISVVKEADGLLSVLAKNQGDFPDFEKKPDKPDRHMPMSPEVPYESRYFSVLFNSDGEVTQTDLRRIISVDETRAIEYGQKALEDGGENGFLSEFRYMVSQEDEGTRITFLDCGRRLNSFYTFLYSSLGMSLLGYIVVFLIVLLCMGRIIRPIAESYGKQKRFITDAGHEIKTPLTIINANVDVLEMELGPGNECLLDIQTQTCRLTELTNDLVYLSRMEEMEESVPMIDFPVSDLISETAASFKALALTQNKVIELQIQPMLTMNGNSQMIEKLVSILMNNALKYSPERSTILVELSVTGRQVVLCVENQSLYFVKKEDLPCAFDRFYRSDASRNSNTGGHGIGLSVARSIVNAHGGEIKAWTRDGSTFGVTVTFAKQTV